MKNMKKMYGIILIVCIILIMFIVTKSYYKDTIGAMVLGISFGFVLSSIMNLLKKNKN